MSEFSHFLPFYHISVNELIHECSPYELHTVNYSNLFFDPFESNQNLSDFANPDNFVNSATKNVIYDCQYYDYDNFFAYVNSEVNVNNIKTIFLNCRNLLRHFDETLLHGVQYI